MTQHIVFGVKNLVCLHWPLPKLSCVAGPLHY